MNQTTMTRQNLRSRQAGFTLSELMIASMIGLFIIAGAISVFTANRQTSALMDRIQSNQDATRFAAQTISRVVRSGARFGAGQTGQLVVEFPAGVAGQDVRDCVGQQISEITPARNIFSSALNQATQRYELLCQSGDDPPVPLIDRLAQPTNQQPNFHVEFLRPDPTTPGELSPTNQAAEATSVRILLRMQGVETIEEIAFIATMRCRVLDCDSN
ncbi:PilW family protein [Thiocapsa imhoffii]|nr:prepilin-type N-terminal cleavage/methylation domain-containing protein [Thiocapsa imhoffii]